jgi:beta-lactamase class A
VKKRKLQIGLVVLLLVCFVSKDQLSAQRTDLTYDPGVAGLAQTVDLNAIEKTVKADLPPSPTIASFYFEPLGSKAGSTSISTGQVRTASMLKLMQVMGLYRSAEEKKLKLDQEVTIEPQWLDSQYGHLWEKGAGTRISLAEAVKLTIIDSDNTAVNVIKAALADHPPSTNPVNQIGFNFSLDSQQKVYSTASDYSKFLECLYYSCYLDKADSDAVLKLMTATDFAGLQNGLPNGTILAHKIGELPDTYDDCGIVYSPRQTYIICLMVASSRDQAIPLIAKVSDDVYKVVTAGN